MEEKYILAIEIGSSKIKGAVGIIDEDGILSVTAIEEEKCIDCVRHGLIINVETVANRVNSIIRKLENRVSPRKARAVYLGIGGRSFRSSPRQVEQQLPIESEITAELINQMRAEALGTALSDRDVVEVADGEYSVDGMHRNNPVGSYGRNIKASFNLITCRQQVMRNIKRVITEKLGLKIIDSFARQISEADLVLSSDERRQGCILVDLGSETTTVSIYKNDVLRYLVTLPLGSRNITRDITHLGYLEERAEELKKLGGNASPNSPAANNVIEGINFNDIDNYVNARATEIIANINEQLQHAQLAVSDLPAGITLIGGGSKLKGLSELMSKITKMPVKAGISSPIVKIADTRINTVDSIDVISVLLAASKEPKVVECMVNPAPAPTPTPEPVNESPVQDSPAAEEEEVDEPARIANDIAPDDDPIEVEKLPKKTRRWFFEKAKKTLENILKDPEDDDETMRDDY